MKKLLLLLPAFFVVAMQLKAQSVEERLLEKKPTCREILLNAASVLPELYKQHAFDSLEKAVGFIQNSCTGINEVFCLKTLLSIQRPSILFPRVIDSNFI